MKAANINSQEMQLKEAQKVVDSVGIPSQPKIVLDIFDLMDKSDSNFKDIAELISKDVSLSAKIIKIANSPFFSPSTPIESIKHALSFLGLENFYQLILSSALQKAMNDHTSQTSNIGIFWSHSMDIAGICKLIVEKFQLEVGDTLTSHYAYLSGLFHDCAIPLLMKRFENYNKVVGLPIQNNPLITNDEGIYFYTNHSVAGYLVAKSWRLPKQV
ncbi:MAG: HDOD domain-containing protein, partial [Calditrichia bacterium]|nr:HDOD domain-containing protein [Calditrichia bacterium]